MSGNRKNGPAKPSGVVPLAEENLHVSRRRVPGETVRVRTRVERSQQTVDEPTLTESVSIERVPINRVVAKPPRIRREGNVTIIPLVEEALEVRKQLVLREELHLRKETRESHEPKTYELRRMRAEVEREPHDQNKTPRANRAHSSLNKRSKQKK